MSSILTKEPLVVGIEITSSSLKLAALKKERKGWKIAFVKEGSLSENVNLLDTLEKNAFFVTALSSTDILVRSLNLPIKKDKDIDAALEFQVEPLLPYPIEKGVFDKIVLNRQPSGTALTICAVRKDHLENHLAQVGKLSIEPEKITAAPLALAALSSSLNTSEKTLLVLHLNEHEGTCALLEEGKLVAARPVEAEITSIQKGVLSLATHPKGKAADSILFFGNHPLLVDSLQEAIGKTIIYPQSTFLEIDSTTLQKFGLAIGIALSGTMENQPNFRKKEFAYPHIWKRIKKPLVTYFLGATLLFAALFSLGKTALHKQEHTLKNAYETLLSLRGNTDKMSLTKEALALSLSAMEKEIEERPSSFPLLPGVPKVSDLLAWLSSHPQVLGNGQEKGIDIEKLRYSMVNLPDLLHKREKYAVRVDLEFSALNPSTARAFHDALLENNPFVDSKREVQWNNGKGKYQTSFFLKDKTRYR